MVDPREELRPLVEQPASGPLPIADLAARAGRRRARRRSVQVAVGAAGALALLGLVVWWPTTGAPDTVTSDDPVLGSDPTTTTADATEAADDIGDDVVDDTDATTRTTGGTEPAGPPPDAGGTSENGGADPFGRIQAHTYNAAEGVEVTELADGDALMVRAGGHVAFYGVDFEAELATRFEVHLASGTGAELDGQIEVRLDRVDSPPIATVPIADTGGWESFTTSGAATSGAIGGRHDIYLTFSSSPEGDLALVDWFRFQR